MQKHITEKGKTEIIIIAAGKGARMISSIPKVMHEIACMPILSYVLNTAIAVAEKIDGGISLVIGKDLLNFPPFHLLISKHPEIKIVVQNEQLGTGHAVFCALQSIEMSNSPRTPSLVMVLYGDTPLISAKTLLQIPQSEELASAHLVFKTNSPSGYGRIITDAKGEGANEERAGDVDRTHRADGGHDLKPVNAIDLNQEEYGTLISIIEDKHASNEQKDIKLCNGAVVLARYDIILKFLNARCHHLSHAASRRSQREIYLTDLPEFVLTYYGQSQKSEKAEGRDQHSCDAMGLKSAVYRSSWVKVDEEEVTGINDRQQLAKMEAIIQDRLRYKHMESGVTMIDPKTVFLSNDTIIANDVTIYPNVWIGHKVKISKNAKIMPFSHIEGVEIGEGSIVGPFARVRHDTVVGNDCRIGNFVEIKNCNIASATKISHLSYIGDANIGLNTNIGAGTVFCNFDGKKKHRSIVGKDVFIGSNSCIVSPVTLGDESIIAAGSVIVADVPDEYIAISRAQQDNKIRRSRAANKKQT